MRHFHIIFAALLISALLFSCVRVGDGNPYMPDLQRLEISLEVPDGDSADYSLAEISVRDINTDATYPARCDDSGKAVVDVPNGVYMVTVSILNGEQSFNGTRSGVVVSGASSDCAIRLSRLRLSDIVIKEIYCGGCLKYPQEGTYQSDSYIILHNNSASTVYLDGLCFGTLDPYNSNSVSVWEEGIDFAPIIQAIWQFPGKGEDFPLGKGEDAIIAVRGAIDHSAYYPQSVNLNREDVFVCYNPLYFANPIYHPAPGPLVRTDHYMNVVIKTGQSNAYTLSINSPAVVIFRAEGTTIQEFVSRSENVIQKPGSDKDRIVCIPNEWVLDGVEVFNGESSSNKKRISPSIDASYVTLSKTFEGRSLMRLTDENMSAKKGYEVLMDTNNSSKDFYERETQSLHK